MTIHLPDDVLDLVLAFAAGSLARDLPYATAERILDTAALHSILGVISTTLVPCTTTVGLRLLPHCKLSVAAKNGRLDILRKRRQYRVKSEHDDVDASVIEASMAGHTDVLQWLLDYESHQGTLSVSNLSWAMGAASEGGHLETLRIWEARSPFLLQDILDFSPFAILMEACRGGSIPVLEWWIAQAHDRDLFSYSHYPQILAQNKHAETLSWWYLTCARGSLDDSPLQWSSSDLTAFVRAASPDLLQSQLSSDRIVDDEILTGSRIYQRHWEFDEWVMAVLSQKPDCGPQLTWWRETRGLAQKRLEEMLETCISAATCEALDWWWSLGLQRNKFRTLVRTAALTGRTDMLDWTERHGLHLAKKVHNHPILSYHVFSGGHLSVVQWYHQRRLYFLVRPNTIRLISEMGHVQLLDWIARTPELKFPCAESGAIDGASMQAHRPVLDWWLRASQDSMFPPGRVTFDYTHEAMDRANTPEILDWWLHSCLPIKHSTDALLFATRHGRKNVLDWWRHSGLLLKCPGYLFDSLYYEEHIDGLQWWWASGLPLKIRNVTYLERQSQVAFLNAAVANGLDQEQPGAPDILVLRWWEEHFLTDAAMNRIELVMQDSDRVRQLRAQWLESASPPGYWKRIRRAARRCRRQSQV
ncbi:hypothetical protein BC828DRAFT_392759 [Blastocladiella britannica]|nr:hypothetical protein BC828DRAFT_392759 [Blastocladiella britannica]